MLATRDLSFFAGRSCELLSSLRDYFRLPFGMDLLTDLLDLASSAPDL